MAASFVAQGASVPEVGDIVRMDAIKVQRGRDIVLGRYDDVPKVVQQQIFKAYIQNPENNNWRVTAAGAGTVDLISEKTPAEVMNMQKVDPKVAKAHGAEKIEWGRFPLSKLED